jgi:hypothetical protein
VDRPRDLEFAALGRMDAVLAVIRAAVARPEPFPTPVLDVFRSLATTPVAAVMAGSPEAP